MTILDEIADTLAEIELPEAAAEKLVALMARQREENARSHRDLMRRPGFAKLWNALDEAARFGAGRME